MPTRSYSSARRELSAAATKADILRAAGKLFVAKGYSETGMPDIAAAAGVSVPTIYASVGTKPQLLLGLLEEAESDRAVEEAMQAVEQALTPARIVSAVARGTRLVVERHDWMLGALYDNAAAEPVIRERLESGTATYRRNLVRAAQQLGDLGALRVDVDSAGTILWFYFGFRPWRTLREAGWEWDAAEQWLTSQVESSILPAGLLSTAP